LLLEPPHSLLHQSWAPRDMRGGGTINADGFGAGWYPPPAASVPPAPGGGPVRYRRDCPIWADENFARLAVVTSSSAVLGAVRSATVGMPVVGTACAPFTDGRWLFSLNGVVFGWPDSVGKLAERLPVADLLTLDAPTDAALVWALLRHRLRSSTPPADAGSGTGAVASADTATGAVAGAGGGAGADAVTDAGASAGAGTGARVVTGAGLAAAAVAETVAELTAAAPGSRLNLLLTDGVTGVATSLGHSLAWRQDAGSVLVASEPLDTDGDWQAVPDGHLIIVTDSTVDILPLERDQS
jgi:glutamine amidotransferase